MISKSTLLSKILRGVSIYLHFHVQGTCLSSCSINCVCALPSRLLEPIRIKVMYGHIACPCISLLLLGQPMAHGSHHYCVMSDHYDYLLFCCLSGLVATKCQCNSSFLFIPFMKFLMLALLCIAPFFSTHSTHKALPLTPQFIHPAMHCFKFISQYTSTFVFNHV